MAALAVSKTVFVHRPRAYTLNDEHVRRRDLLPATNTLPANSRCMNVHRKRRFIAVHTFCRCTESSNLDSYQSEYSDEVEKRPFRVP